MTTTMESTVSKRLRRESGEPNRLRRTLTLVLVMLLVISFVRWVTGANDITSTGTVGAALRLGVPIAMAGLGGLYAERAGIVNIGLEGMMILGTWFGAWAAWKFGNPWYGVAGGAIGGALGGLLHAVATVTFNVDHVVSGVAINILGAGVTRYLSVIAYANANVPGAGATQSPRVSDSGTWSLPVVSGGKLFGWQSPDALSSLERHHWFLVSDLAGMLHGVTNGVSWLTLVAIALLPLSFFVLWRTAFGLRLRSCGENPFAAESLGVPVYTMKYVAVVLSGALAGFGGAFLAIVGAGIYREGQTGGRGFIGLAAMIFGNWRPGGLAAGASLFGYADALQLRSSSAVHALLLFVAIVLVFIALRAARLRRMLTLGLGLAFGALFFAWYFASDTVPNEFVTFTPHLTTLLVLAIASQRLRPPAWDGLPFRKGQTV
jgi:simple sugar transport system permease protein